MLIPSRAPLRLNVKNTHCAQILHPRWRRHRFYFQVACDAFISTRHSVYTSDCVRVWGCGPVVSCMYGPWDVHATFLSAGTLFVGRQTLIQEQAAVRGTSELQVLAPLILSSVLCLYLPARPPAILSLSLSLSLTPLISLQHAHPHTTGSALLQGA